MTYDSVLSVNLCCPPWEQCVWAVQPTPCAQRPRNRGSKVTPGWMAMSGTSFQVVQGDGGGTEGSPLQVHNEFGTPTQGQGGGAEQCLLGGGWLVWGGAPRHSR